MLPLPGEPPTESQVGGELTALRQRGLQHIDVDTSKQHRIDAPCLEAMARQSVSGAEPRPTPRRRSDLLAAFLQQALNAFAETDRSGRAEFIRPLFFDPDGVNRSAGELLSAARRNQRTLAKDAFDRQRQAAFLAFARFLVDEYPLTASDGSSRQVPGTNPLPAEHGLAVPDAEVGSDTATRRPHRGKSIAIAVGAAVVVAVVTGFALAGRDGGPAVAGPQGATQESRVVHVVGAGGDQGGAVSPEGAMLTFDSLGGTSSTFISVFPGVTESAEDRTRNGTFAHGDAVRALCATTGRIVESDTGAGEVPRTSDVWIGIEGSPGTRQYATLTYARISDGDLATLPPCS